MSASFLLPVKLGRPVFRHLPDEILAYVKPDDWTAFCDAFDRLAMNTIDRNSSILMRFSMVIGLACLVLVILFGYLDAEDEDDSGDDANPQDEEDDNDGGISTPVVLLTALPICFPFVMAAFLNCHAASTVSRLLALCRTSCGQWAASKSVEVTVEQLQSVSNEDEVIDTFLIQFNPPPDTREELAESGGLPETSPRVVPDKEHHPLKIIRNRRENPLST